MSLFKGTSSVWYSDTGMRSVTTYLRTRSAYTCMRHPNKEEREQMELKRGKWKEKAGNNVE